MGQRSRPSPALVRALRSALGLPMEADPPPETWEGRDQRARVTDARAAHRRRARVAAAECGGFAGVKYVAKR